MGLNDKNIEEGEVRKEVISVGKNSLVYVGGRVLSQAVGFLMIPVYTRFIAPENYGAMDLMEMVAAMIMMIAAMGVGDSMSRYFYAEKDFERRDEIVSTIIIGFSVISLPIIIFFICMSGYISSIVIGDSTYQSVLQIAVITVWFGVLCEILFTYMRMLYMAKMFVIVTTFQLIVALSFNIYFVVYAGFGISGIFYSNLIAQSIIAVVMSIFVLRKVGTRVSLPLLKNLMQFGLPLVPARISQFLGFASNRFFLRWLGSPNPETALALVGLFSLGNKFGSIVSRFVTSPVNSFWGPRRIELLLTQDARETVALICTYAVMLTFYVALGLCAGIESLIELIASPQYQGAHIVVPFVALSYVALAIDWHFSAGIIYSRKTIWATYSSILSLVVIVIWNFIFIPKWGVLGAATSNLAGYAVRLVVNYLISQRLYRIPFEKGRILQLFIVAVVVYFVCQTIQLPSVSLTFLTRIFVAMFYPILLFFTGFYRKNEIEIILQLMKTKKNYA